MDNVFTFQVVQCIQYLYSKSADKAHRDTIKIIKLEKIIKIDTEYFKNDSNMVSKLK